MSPDDIKIHEAHERAELAHADQRLAPVSASMAILAVLTAAISTLGHRAHNEVLLAQTRANFQKAELVGKGTQQHVDLVLLDLLGVMNSQNSGERAALREKLNRELQNYENHLSQVSADEGRLESEGARARKKANRLDLGELLCEMGLVLSSITLLSKRRHYWYAGLVAAVVGFGVALSGFLL